MPKVDGRRRWRVEFPTGEVIMLRQLRAVRLTLSADPHYKGAAHLTRLERGRYYGVITWSTSAGRRAGLVLVTRVTARRAELELVNEPLPFAFDEDDDDRARVSDGL